TRAPVRSGAREETVLVKRVGMRLLGARGLQRALQRESALLLASGEERTPVIPAGRFSTNAERPSRDPFPAGPDRRCPGVVFPGARVGARAGRLHRPEGLHGAERVGAGG